MPSATEDGGTSRLLQFKAKEFAQWAKASSEKLLASTSGMFAKVRSSAAALGETLGEFEALESSAPRLEMRTPDLSDTFREMQEFHRRQALERAEELQMVRLTGRMTAESARTLKDLAEAATELLDKWGERDEKADRATRKQLNIAVFSVVVSAVLALVAVIMSGLGLRQDGINNAAAERSQAELISAVKESGLQREAAELEALGLRRKIDDLEEKIAHLESLASAPQKSPEPGSGQSATSKPARQKP